MKSQKEIPIRRLLPLYAGLIILVASGMNCPPGATNTNTTPPGPGPVTPPAATHIPGGIYFITRANSTAWVWMAGSKIDQTPPDLTGVISLRFDTDGWPMSCDGRISVGYVDLRINGRPMTVTSVDMNPQLTLSNGSSGPGVTVHYKLQQQASNPNDLLPIYEGTGVIKTIYIGDTADGTLYSERDFSLGNSSVYGIEAHSKQWLKTSNAQPSDLCQ